MQILALETSGTTGSVALWSGDQRSEPRQWHLPQNERSGRSLAPAIHKALAEMRWKPAEIELVAVTAGPGSFTGLRVGVVTAKTFAFAVGCPVVGVNTLRVIAQQGVLNASQEVRSVMDAQRGELFASKWNYNSLAHPTPYGELQPTTLVTADEWMSCLQPGDWITGPGLEKFITSIPNDVNVVDRVHWQPQAATVAWVGFEAFQLSEDSLSFDPFALTPTYYRRTAAEEQWEKRRGIANSS